jgi:REP element-mobilizing transposase RayT
VSCIVHAQLVFLTRYRHPVFTARHLGRTEKFMRAVCTDFETGLAEFNGETSHVHLLVNFPPKLALSRLVNSVRLHHRPEGRRTSGHFGSTDFGGKASGLPPAGFGPDVELFGMVAPGK